MSKTWQILFSVVLMQWMSGCIGCCILYPVPANLRYWKYEAQLIFDLPLPVFYSGFNAASLLVIKFFCIEQDECCVIHKRNLKVMVA